MIDRSIPSPWWDLNLAVTGQSRDTGFIQLALSSAASGRRSEESTCYKIPDRWPETRRVKFMDKPSVFLWIIYRFNTWFSGMDLTLMNWQRILVCSLSSIGSQLSAWRICCQSVLPWTISQSHSILYYFAWTGQK